MSGTVKTVPTEYGEGRLVLQRARKPIVTLLISHGAGTGIDTVDLLALAETLPRQGVTVARFEQPWKVAGRSVASPPKTLDAGLRAAAGVLKARTPLVVGGRSAGARSAARCARDLGAAGCLAIAFPLHPPGKPQSSRLEELVDVGVPTLVVQGERDAFGGPDEFPQIDGVDLAVVPGGDHSLKVLKRGPLSQEDALAVLVESTLEWIVREIVGVRA